MGDMGAQHFSHALQHNTVNIHSYSCRTILLYTLFMQTLTKVNLGFNHIGPIGAQYLANGLQQNTASIPSTLDYSTL